MSSTEDKFIFSQNDLPVASFHRFGEMRSNGDLCDVTFRTENLEISAHRLVLAANIPYFRAMFLSNMAETSTKEINFQGIESKTFVSLIDSAYGQKIEINPDNVMSLIMGASFLQMDHICDACCEFLTKKLNAGNVLNLREFASTHGLLKLQQSTGEYLQRHFTEMSNKEEFLDLPFSYFKELISKDELCVPSEELVFQVVMSWVKRSADERKEELPELLTSVRMPLLSYRYLSSHVASEDLIQNSTPCRNLLEEAKDYRIIREKGSLHCSFITRQRRLLQANDSDACLYAVCKKEEGFPYAYVERYDLRVRRWTTMEGKTMCVEDTTVVVMGKKIYVIGGCDRQGKVLDIVQVFDTECDSWSTAAVLKVPKRLVAATGVHNKLYVCGGQTVKNVISDVECYCSVTNEWTHLPPMLQCRSAACAVSCGMYIYVVGGYGGDSADPNYKLKSFERYHSEAKQWILLSETSFFPYRCGVAALNDGMIYAHTDKCVEVYDPWARKWNKISSVKNQKSSLHLLSLGGKLCIITKEGRMFQYDPETNEWSEKERVPKKIHVIGVVSGREN